MKKLTEILKGIDCTEPESELGWWETSDGAEFGKQKLTEVLDYCDKQFARIEELEQQADTLRAENETLKKAINEHNQDLEASCAVMHTERSGMCHHYESRGRNCCDCPKDYAIELSGEGE